MHLYIIYKYVYNNITYILKYILTMMSGLYYLNIYMHTNSTTYFKDQENKTLF